MRAEDPLDVGFPECGPVITGPPGGVNLGAAVLYLGDCRDILPTVSGIEAIISDPPYGVGFNYSLRRSRKSGLKWGPGNESNPHHDRGWRNVLHDDEPFDPSHLLRFPEVILWGGNNFASRLPDSRGWLVWDKLGNKRPSNFGDVEFAWTNRSMPARVHRQLWRGMVRQGEENVSRGPKLHPAQKPVALMQWCVRFTTGVVICDPYMGSGTTGVAAIREGRQFVGMEKDPNHFAVARDRIAREIEIQRNPKPPNE